MGGFSRTRAVPPLGAAAGSGSGRPEAAQIRVLCVRGQRLDCGPAICGDGPGRDQCVLAKQRRSRAVSVASEVVRARLLAILSAIVTLAKCGSARDVPM